MDFKLHTLNGTELLKEYSNQDDSNYVFEAKAFLAETNIIYKNRCNAMLRQLLKELPDASYLNESIVFINFGNGVILGEHKNRFLEMLDNGILLTFNEFDGAKRFVPFEKSSSQTREGVLSFIDERYYDVMRKRLDLDLDMTKVNQYSVLSKLYAYRGLYLSDGQLIYHGNEESAKEFFHENNIIVIDSFRHKIEKRVYTAEPKAFFNNSEEQQTEENRELSFGEKTEKIEIELFDGEGIISKDAAEALSLKIEELNGVERHPDDTEEDDRRKENNVSFQVRMPFFKGVLNKVDFHRFLKEEVGITNEDEAKITDCFGYERNLFKANIIVTTSMFKLKSLDFNENLVCPSEDPMAYYFDKIKQYDHGLYVLRSDRNIHNNGYVSLSNQILNTLDMNSEAFDDLIEKHIKRADLYTAASIASSDSFKGDDSMEAIHKLLREEPRFINDRHIETYIENCRVSKYNAIGLGKIEVMGELRFLSGDLIDFLYRLAKNVKLSEKQKANLEKIYRLPNGKVYLPNAIIKNTVGRKIGLFRSPHLSRNEDVHASIFCERTKDGNNTRYYEKYMSHLKSVVMVGSASYIPHALGGADFDGDFVVVAYEPTVAKACESGYAEEKNEAKPFIHIPKPKIEKVSTASDKESKYVCPSVIFNTFSNKIGHISNSALKIAAVEYHNADYKEGDISSALCTILTGWEIDAAKNGAHPDLTIIEAFMTQYQSTIKKVSDYLKFRDSLKKWGGRAPRIERLENGNLKVLDKDIECTYLTPNRDLSLTCQLAYRWANAFCNKKDKERIERNAEEVASIWAEYSNCPDEIKDMLNAFKKSFTAYKRFNKRKSDISNESRRFEGRIINILKGQYDSIYAGCDGLSPEAKYNALVEELIESGLTAEELRHLRDELHNEENFSPSEFWPFDKEKTAAEALPANNTDIVKNFNFQGYKLLHYVLDVAVKEAEKSENEEKTTDAAEKLSKKNRFYEAFAKTQIDCINDKMPVSETEKEFVKTAKTFIAEYFENDSDADIIKKIYPALNQSQRDYFWKIYDIKDVLKVFEGDNKKC